MAKIVSSDAVKFCRGKKENLPEGAQKVEIYMVPGKNELYFIFENEIEGDPNLKNEMKNENLILK